MKCSLAVLVALTSGFAVGQSQEEALTLLQSPDFSVALTKILAEKDQLAPEIIILVNHTNPHVRQRAIQALLTIDTAGLAIRSEESEGLGKNRPAAVTAIAKVASDPAPHLKKAAIEALLYLLRNREFGHHGEPWSDPHELLPIINLGRDATPYLSNFLTRENKEDRLLYAAKLSAIRVLKVTHDPAAINSLLHLVSKSEHWLLSEVMNALAEFDDPRIAPAIINRIDETIGGYGETPGIWALRSMQDRAVPALFDAISNHRDPKIRALCVTVFTRQPSSLAMRALKVAASDQNDRVRQITAKALVNIPSAESRTILLRLLADHSRTVRLATVDSLGNIADPTTFDQIAPLLKEKDQDLREEALIALAKIDGKRSTPILINCLPEQATQQSVIYALNLIRPNEAILPLIKVVENPNSKALTSAIELLGDMRAEAAIPTLRKLCREQESKFAYECLKALGKIGSASTSALIELSAQLPESKLPYLLDALGKTHDPTAYEVIKSYLEQPELLLDAIEALGELGDRRAIPLIISYFDEENTETVSAAITAAGDLKAVETLPHLMKFLEPKGKFVKEAAIALGKTGDPVAFDSLMSLAQVEAVDLETGEIKYSAILALGYLRDRRAIPYLIELTKREDVFSEYAIESLGKIGDPLSLDALRIAEKSEYSAISMAATAAIKLILSK